MGERTQSTTTPIHHAIFNRCQPCHGTITETTSSHRRQYIFVSSGSVRRATTTEPWSRAERRATRQRTPAEIRTSGKSSSAPSLRIASIAPISAPYGMPGSALTMTDVSCG